MIRTLARDPSKGLAVIELEAVISAAERYDPPPLPGIDPGSAALETGLEKLRVMLSRKRRGLRQ